jgi:hypothetical protein
MDRWEELVLDYERAIAQSQPERAVRLLAEFTLTAPAASVRRHSRRLLKASTACAAEQTREQLISTLELLRQRATLTESSLSLVRSKRPERERVTKREKGLPPRRGASARGGKEGQARVPPASSRPH